MSAFSSDVLQGDADILSKHSQGMDFECIKLMSGRLECRQAIVARM